MDAVTSSQRLRQVVNWINLSTLLGLLFGTIGRARFESGPDGLIFGRGYRLTIPPAPAFTVGNVVLLRIDRARLAARPRLIGHEARHATQYAWCLGPVMLVLYVLAAALSWVLTGDPASRNVFERHAGLKAGGYIEKPLRPMFRRRTRSGTF
jgi:hypothetical protein